MVEIEAESESPVWESLRARSATKMSLGEPQNSKVRIAQIQEYKEREQVEAW